MLLTSVTLYALMFATSSCQLSPWPTKENLDVIASLLDLYHVHCVFLVASEESLLSTGPRIAQTQKLLSAKGTFSSLLDLEDLTLERRCHSNRPLNVIVSDDDVTWKYLAALDKVPSLPRWLAFFDGDPAALLRDVNIEFNCVFLVGGRAGGVATVTLTEVYRVQRERPLEVARFAAFTAKRGLDKDSQDFAYRRANLHGIKLRACIRNLPPIVRVIRTLGSPPRIGGFFGVLWNILESELNFTTEYSLPADGQTGIKLPNGTWTGCINMLLLDQSDVAACDFTMTTDRIEAAAFLFPALVTKQLVYLVEPTLIDLSWNNFLAPFSLNLWMAILSSVVLLSLSLAATYRCGRRIGNAEAEGPDTMDLSQALIYILGLACGQGHEVTPRALSGRIVYQVAALTGIIVTASYAAALISFLTVSLKPFPVNTFDELLAKRYKLLIRSPSGQLTLFQTTSDPLFSDVYAKLILPLVNTAPRTVDEGLARVCAEAATAFMTYPESIVDPKALPCALVPVPSIHVAVRFAMVTAKDNPFHDILNTNMLKILHSGALRGVRLRFWPKVYPEIKQDSVEVSLAQATPIITIIVAGLCMGVLVFGLEKWMYSCYSKKLFNNFVVIGRRMRCNILFIRNSKRSHILRKTIFDNEYND